MTEKRAGGEGFEITCFFSTGTLPKSGIHSIMSKTGRRQAGEAKLLLRNKGLDRGEEGCFDLEI